MEDRDVIIDYTNHRGERALRKITPSGTVHFKKTAYHPRMQWLLPAFDHSKGQHREFAMDHIHAWTPVEHIRNMPLEGNPQNGQA